MDIVDWKDYVQDSDQHTVVGHMKIIESFPMPQFDTTRRIWIYLPPNYYESKKSYPVLYMHDGQNLFDKITSYAGEWQIDNSMDRLFAQQQSEGAIVVGIDNGGGDARFEEYIPKNQGAKYLNFLVHTLKPFIDKNFHTLPGRNHTGIAGSSLGGLISLYIGLKRSDVFSKIGAFSPAMSFAGDSFNGCIKVQNMKIYLDVGTQEHLPYNSYRKYAHLVWVTYYQLICAGFSNDELKLFVDKDAGHEEAAWGRRFPVAFLWLFAKD